MPRCRPGEDRVSGCGGEDPGPGARAAGDTVGSGHARRVDPLIDRSGVGERSINRSQPSGRLYEPRAQARSQRPSARPCAPRTCACAQGSSRRARGSQTRGHGSYRLAGRVPPKTSPRSPSSPLSEPDWPGGRLSALLGAGSFGLRAGRARRNVTASLPSPPPDATARTTATIRWDEPPVSRCRGKRKKTFGSPGRGVPGDLPRARAAASTPLIDRSGTQERSINRCRGVGAAVSGSLSVPASSVSSSSGARPACRPSCGGSRPGPSGRSRSRTG